MTDTSADQTPIDRARFEVHEDVDPKFTVRVLTPRKRRMVEAYVREGTYAAAALASGYAAATVKKYIDDDPDIRRAIGHIIDQAAILAGVTLERVIQEYARLAFSDIGDVIEVLEAAGDSDAALGLLGDLPQDVTASIKSIDYRKKHEEGDEGAYVDGHLKIAFHDKRGALTDLGRMLALFNDKVTIEGGGFGDRLMAAVKKIEEISE